MPELRCTPPLSPRVDVPRHGARLRVLAEHVVVVGRAGAFIDRSAAPWTWSVNRPAPISQLAPSAALPRVLFHQGAEDVGHRFVDRAGLVVVGQPRRNWVTPWVSSWPITSSEREPGEDLAVAVAEDHLRRPRRRSRSGSVVHGRLERQPGASIESRAKPLEEAVGVTEAVVGLVSGSDRRRPVRPSLRTSCREAARRPWRRRRVRSGGPGWGSRSPGVS